MSVTTRLPIADGRAVRRYVGQVAHRHPRLLWTALALHIAAALSALAAPRLLGDLVQSVEDGTTAARVDSIVLWLAFFLVLQSVLTRFARYRSQVMGELVLAELREDFVSNTLALPIGTVEAAGSGDLLTRTGSDIDQLGWSVRWALPEWTIAVLSAALTFAAALSVGWWVALPCLLALPPLVIGLRWYLARAKDGYLAETASYSQINTTLSETVEGARTVEALGLGPQRVRLSDEDCAASFRAERYTLHLRTVFFPSMELSYLLPVVGTLLFGGWLYTRGDVTLAEVTTATLYVQMLIDPVDRIVSILDELQLGAASLSRLLGVAQVPDDRSVTGRTPSSEKLDAEEVHFSYVEGRDVLHGVDLDVGVGERIAIVGPSGAGKSTLGRLLAGIHPPRTGSVTVGDVGLVELPLGDLRGHVALVTQEHHVFVGTIRENLILARPSASDSEVHEALAAVDASEWVAALPSGLDTVVGSGGRALTAAQAQQIALARLVLADPHTLVLDEATSLIDPRAARHLERSLAAVLEGRTVIAIAHRLFSAHDADRVAVVEDGVISEFGSHDELVAAGGSYAALWESWHGTADHGA
ncbi:MAG: yheI 2 [Nocardioides sp.]|jgi:ABC-type multidrug transport system fused ATPase/permease subunit|uniref:ABC transporter ATP-binding protein n=1 Tax=Nocardioides sp. TaxID=35761 RepID=UPI00261BDB7E|nr:ABC transporter ATP-binding protein [Nocardioides sp.]MCW2834346.1 yheI 2 [Nocardioides sp.]